MFFGPLLPAAAVSSAAVSNPTSTGTVASTQQANIANASASLVLSGSSASNQQTNTSATIGDIPSAGAVATSQANNAGNAAASSSDDGSAASAQQGNAAYASGTVVSGSSGVATIQATPSASTGTAASVQNANSTTASGTTTAAATSSGGAVVNLPNRLNRQPNTNLAIAPQWRGRLKFAVVPSVGFLNFANDANPINVRGQIARSTSDSGVTWDGGAIAEYVAPIDISKGLTLISIWRALPAQYNGANASTNLISSRTSVNQGWSWGRGGAISGGSTGNLTQQEFTLQSVAQIDEPLATIESLVDTPVAVRYTPGTGTVSFFRFGQRSSVDVSGYTSPTSGGNIVFGAQGSYAESTPIFGGRTSVVLAFEGALTDAEIYRLSNNTSAIWQVFQSQPRRISIGGVAVVAGAILTGASTQQSNTANALASNLVSGAGTSNQQSNNAVSNASSAVAGAGSSTQAANSTSSSGSVVAAGVTGTSASTQQANTGTAVAAVANQGNAASTQALNSAVASGTVTAAGVRSGAAASTQQVNTGAAVGSSLAAGTSTSAEQTNTTTAAGNLTSAGTSATTQALNTTTAAGSVTAVGASATTQQSNSSIAFGSVVAAGAIAGSAAQTQIANVAAAYGAASIAAYAISLQSKNTGATVGSASASGTASAIQALNTTAASAVLGLPSVTGSASAAQSANFSAAFGLVAVTGAAAATQQLNTTTQFFVQPTLIMQLQAMLDPLMVGGAWYAVNTSEPPIYPYVVFQRITSSANVSLEGPSDLQSTLVQVDVYSRLISEADALGKLIAGSFAAWTVPNAIQSSQDMYEAPVKAFRVSQDFMVWSAF